MTPKLMLWLAQGLGIGRIPVAPGTFGSLLGLGWYALLLWSHNPWIFIGGAVGLIVVAVPVCEAAEKILTRKDPASVVLDEVAAVPVCFAAWTALYARARGGLPGLPFFAAQNHWVIPAVVFILFRIFDVLKPWPARQSQALPGGWGIVVDDLLAALYVNLIMIAASPWFGMFST